MKQLLKLFSLKPSAPSPEKARVSLWHEIRHLLFQKKHKFSETFAEYKRRFAHIGDTNFELGKYHFYQGNLSDAIMRFKGVVFFNPQSAPAHYYLGRCYLQKDNKSAAIKSFETALACDPKLTQAQYFLSILQFPERIRRVNPLYLSESMDETAPDYTRMQLEKGYQGHIISRELLLNHLPEQERPVTLLDLGCGGGLGVKALREKSLIRSATGVDISQGAIRALEKEMHGDELLYHNLKQEDAETFLSTCHQTFDVVLATNLLHYFSSLDTLLHHIADVLRGGGICIGTIFLSNEKRWEFDSEHHRFQHLRSYLKDEANRNQLDLVEERQIPLYTQDPANSQALFFVCKKRGAVTKA